MTSCHWSGYITQKKLNLHWRKILDYVFTPAIRITIYSNYVTLGN